jgi:hypothetical protein
MYKKKSYTVFVVQIDIQDTTSFPDVRCLLRTMRPTDWLFTSSCRECFEDLCGNQDLEVLSDEFDHSRT